MNVPSHVTQLLKALRTAGFTACPVGGCVRDSLLGRRPSDWDLCTAAPTGCALWQTLRRTWPAGTSP